MGTYDKDCTGGEVSQLEDILQNKLTDSEFLTAAVTKEEVYDTIKHMPSNESPGHDGFTAEFFKSSWNVIGELVSADVREFFL